MSNKRSRSEIVTIVTVSHSFTAISDQIATYFVSENSTLYLCDACLTFFASENHLVQHITDCAHLFWVPGNEIYRNKEKKFCVYEIDGRNLRSFLFLRRLGILTRFFLPEKVTLDDVHFFAFYALFEVDDYGFHFVGYFSKEWRKNSACVNTLSCVMVLPPYRAKGYGSFLGELSYELARQDGMVGTPERPLSGSGKLLFRKVWKGEVLRAIHLIDSSKSVVTLNTLCQMTGLIVEDVLVGLEDLGIMFTRNKQSPFIILLEEKKTALNKRRLQPQLLQWVPC
ncbi:histone acetyltransferase HTATIP [Angomonas deanei]|nr:histone acetyltransferase HTATIP [Angomonas deanei]|eukprot:EPY37488.1 histone acetyltransferase HTATIP [Angomonas deanei]